VEQNTVIYIAIGAIVVLIITILISSIILISNTRRIRRDLDNLWHNCQPFQMAQAFEYMGEKEKAILCYKETLFNVVHRRFRIPKMNKKLQIDYLESKIISLGGKLPDSEYN
jgi:biopolymer transport protein ExbB/TolQ